MTSNAGWIRNGLLASTSVLAAMLAVTLVAAQSSDRENKTPTGRGPTANFSVELVVDGQVFSGFNSVSGLTSKNEIVEFREGSEEAIRKIPGLTKYGNITLKRGVTSIDDLWVWRRAIADGTAFDRRNGSVIIYDNSGAAISRWNFEQGWPAKWSGPDFETAGGTEVAMESITLAVERIDKG